MKALDKSFQMMYVSTCSLSPLRKAPLVTVTLTLSFPTLTWCMGLRFLYVRINQEGSRRLRCSGNMVVKGPREAGSVVMFTQGDNLHWTPYENLYQA